MYRDKSLIVSRTTSPAGLSFAGEIDISNSSAVAETLRSGLNGELASHIDLSCVSFCDVSGIRALVTVAREIGPDRHLLLHGLPNQIEMVMKIVGWTDLPGLDLCACEVDQ